jgi:hypothetical protein
MESWPLVMALSRFGTFSELRSTRSSSTDTAPDTPGFTFRGAAFSSPYLTFTGVETGDRNAAPLQRLTSTQAALVQRYDAPPYVDAGSTGAIPFILWGDVAVTSGASYQGSSLSGFTLAQAATALVGRAATGPSGTPLSAAARAAAGAMVTTICGLIHDTAPACAAPAGG